MMVLVVCQHVDDDAGDLEADPQEQQLVLSGVSRWCLVLWCVARLGDMPPDRVLA
ncbi:hypothetical protein [Dactylosporangium sp. CA-092794]|uniref:hypothetical protein n=1 Tax=Dactylosporangium sp. CA-092794 TaxID=3239929 RepID=UPI003D931927